MCEFSIPFACFVLLCFVLKQISSCSMLCADSYFRLNRRALKCLSRDYIGNLLKNFCICIHISSKNLQCFSQTHLYSVMSALTLARYYLFILVLWVQVGENNGEDLSVLLKKISKPCTPSKGQYVHFNFMLTWAFCLTIS